MGWALLYLDSCKDKAVFKALARHGKVEYVDCIDDALFRMAEVDFDYFFVDADVPQSLAFIKHVRHDPQLPPPRAVVLLTGNTDEDCEAWSVDTFVNKAHVYEDLPFIFSHFRQPSVDDTAVIRIAPEPLEHNPVQPSAAVKRLKGLSRNGSGPGETVVKTETESVDIAESVRRRGDRRDVSGRIPGAVPTSHGSLRQDLEEEPTGRFDRSATEGRRVTSRSIRITAAVLGLAAIAAWIIFLGPFGGAGKKAGNSSSSVSAEKRDTLGDSRQTDLKTSGAVSDSAPDRVDATPVTASEPQSAPSDPAGADGQSQAAVTAQPAAAVDVGPPPAAGEAAPPVVPAANNAPRVSISGPSTVKTGETATYTATAGDADGDPISYSWGGCSRAKCWNAPGQYEVSVTATDSRGASASASMLVTVM